MEAATQEWIGTVPCDAALAVALARDLFLEGGLAELPDILRLADEHGGLWPSAAGQELLAGILADALDLLAGGHAEAALAALGPLVGDGAAHAFDLLVQAFYPDGAIGDAAELDDAALLCLAILAAGRGHVEDAAGFLDTHAADRAGPMFGPPARVIRDHFARAAADRVFKPKLIVWDLDDTLWRGTLADGDLPILDENRAGIVRALNNHGIVSAICSKNDPAQAQAQLEAFGLWDAFVFPRIAFVPKGEVVRQLIADMQLLSANVLFVDDNPRNLREVEAAVPGIHVIDATSPECDRLLRRILDDHAHVAKSRVADYRLLERKVGERRQSALTDEAFLRQSDIHATSTHRMDNLDFAARIEELVNRSNQLNYTGSRLASGEAEQLILNVSDYDVFSAFVWDRYGYYGLVGVAVYDKTCQALIHFAFSCRIMHMGIEDFLLRELGERYPHIDLARLTKALPEQSAAAIRRMSFAEPEVRARVLAEEAPRDWSSVRLRLMCDCQSGAFHHYSRFRDAYDFDNIPRLFSLPMMLTGEWARQAFPADLVYTPSTDYMDWRWAEVMPIIDPATYADAAARFVAIVADGGHRLLLILPPETAGDDKYAVIPTATPEQMRARNRAFNELWRALAAQQPERIRVIELEGLVGEDEMVRHAYHYVPSALRTIAALIDDWHAEAR